MLKNSVQTRKKIRRNSELKRVFPAGLSHPNRTHLMAAIQHELGVGQTYLTIARLAYDMGQTGRGDRARARALEACADAARLIALLPVPAPSVLSKKLEALHESLKAVSPDAPAFPAPLRQPSMS
ncbi:MAG TPA: hypothetical protein VHZ07_13655 [Bryobacteraceae bacterium]|jgi:hypothetical protein|nr:hypothetical protein [Bryobacteraceae bacterium]